jgi:hypothetical protein
MASRSLPLVPAEHPLDMPANHGRCGFRRHAVHWFPSSRSRLYTQVSQRRLPAHWVATESPDTPTACWQTSPGQRPGSMMAEALRPERAPPATTGDVAAALSGRLKDTPRCPGRCPGLVHGHGVGVPGIPRRQALCNAGNASRRLVYNDEGTRLRKLQLSDNQKRKLELPRPRSQPGGWERANKRKHIRAINGRLGLATPEIITPFELFREEDDL